MMKVDLISKTNAITVLSTFFPEESWQDVIDDHIDVSHAEGMEFLLKEDLMEFIMINTEGVFEPEHARLFCSGLIMGIEVEANRLFYAEVDQVLKDLDSGAGVSLVTPDNQTKAKEVAA